MPLSNELIREFVKVTSDKPAVSKESTVYGTIVDYNGSKWVKIDGSELLTPFSQTTNVTAGERVTVTIKDHTATVTGNLTSPSARNEDVDNLGKELGSQITEVEILVAGKVSAEYLEGKYATIESLNATNATIENLDATYAKIDDLTATNAKIDNLDATYAKIGDLEAINATIENLDATYAKIEILESDYAKIGDLEATDIKVNNLEATYGEFQELTTKNFEAVNAKIESLDVDYLTAEEADIKYATIVQLEAIDANVGTLTADVADINTLIFGSATGDTIHANFANAVVAQLGDAQIKSAMIDSVSANKITAGDIITNNVRVLSEDGSLLISDETIQISDENRIRVQIGKDAANDYSINIWDASGKLMFSEGGLTADGVKEAIIRNDMVSESANIAASKLDIDSLFTEINGSSNTIKSTKIYLDDKKQTLDVAFTSMTNSVNGLSNTVSSQGTQISTIQGQITSKIWQQDITTAKNELGEDISDLSTQYSELNQTVSGLSSTVASHTSQIAKKADNSTVTTINDKVTSLEQNLSGFKTTVSNTYATKTELATTDTKASKAQEDISVLTERVVTAETLIEQNSDAISLRATKTELNSVSSVVDSISSNLSTNYYTKTQTDAQIKVSSDAIISSVSATYATQTELSETDAKATNAQNDVDSLETRVTQTESSITSQASSISSLGTRVSTIEQTADGLTISLQTTNNNVTNAQNTANAAQNAVNNLTLGGRNLVAGTSLDTVYSGNKGSSTYKDVWTAKTIDIPTETEYVVSFEAKADAAQTIYCYFYSPNTTTNAKSSTGQSGTSADGSCVVSITTAWKRYWVKWTQTAATAVKNVIIGRNYSTSNIHIRAVKLEAGHTPSAWSPAPEDVSDSIDTAQTTANTANSAASVAQGMASSASSAAAAAQSTANTAQTNASTALSNASTAQSTANTAKSNAANAQSTANTARTEAANAAKTATNYLNFSSSGLVVGDMTASTLGRNVLIDSDSIDIRNGSTVLASFGEDSITLGNTSSTSTIYLAGAAASMHVYNSSSSSIRDSLLIH